MLVVVIDRILAALVIPAHLRPANARRRHRQVTDINGAARPPSATTR